MHFWIDKRSQANINQCRANARLTLNRLQPLEYVRPPHQQHHHTSSSHNNNSSTTRNSGNNNSSNSSSNNNIYHFNYSDFSNNTNNNTNSYYNNNNNNNNNSNSIFRNSLNRNSNRHNSINNNNQSNSVGNTPHNLNMINTAATGSAHTSYRIPHHQNIDIDPTFNPNDQHNSQEPVIRQQPHLRWQVLVIFTFFVVTIRFYVLGNRSEVLIYCISGLILVMALLIFSALNLQKKLTNGNNNCSTTSPRFDGVQHTRLINTTSRVNGGNNSMNSSHHHQHSEQQISTGNRCPYVQQLVLQNAGPLGRNGTNHRDAQILAEAVVLLPPSPTQLLQDQSEVRRNHSENSIAPPPYDKAILLPGNSKNKKFIGIEIESSEDETPPPSYAAVTDINN